jgi:hypothetical protein
MSELPLEGRGNTFNFESEVISQMTTFMITPKKPEGVGIPNFERPKVKDTLYLG